MKALEKLADKSTAEFLNTKVERALASNNENSLANFFKSVTKEKGTRSPLLVNLKGKLKEIVAEAVETGNFELTDDHYRAIAMETLGIGMSKQELGKVISLTKNFEDTFKATKGGTFNFNKPDEFINYWKANNELHKYLQTLDEAPLFAIWVSQIRRASMLFSFKSPIKNVISNSIQGMFIHAVKRIETIPEIWKTGDIKEWFRGMQSTEADSIARTYKQTALKVYRETGIDITRTFDLNENPSVMRELQDAVHAEGRGIQRKLARGMNEVAFKNLMGVPDILASAWQKVSTVRLEATRAVRKLGLTEAEATAKFNEIVADSLQIAPKSEVAQAIQIQSIKDATTATWTNNSELSQLSLGTREYLNKMTGQLRLGDWRIAFAKTPANVISAQLDIAGVGWARGLVDIVKLSQANDPIVKQQLGRSAVRHIVTSGGGMLVAGVIYATLQPDDYIGDYESYTPTQRRLIEAKGGVYNSIRFDIPFLGKRYVSLDYLGGFGAAIAGMMAAKQQDSAWDKITAYSSTAGGVLMNLPGISEIKGLATDVADYFVGSPEQKTKILEEAATDTLGDVMSVIPQVIYDIDKALFKEKTQPDYDDYWQVIKAKLPFVRASLPKDTNIFGSTIVQRGFLGQMIFGGGVSIANDGDVLNELDRLWKTGNLPTVTDVASASTRFKSLKDQIGSQKFGQALIEYGQLYGKNAQKEIKKASYKKLSNEDKTERINAARTEAMEAILKKYKYKPSKK